MNELDSLKKRLFQKKPKQDDIFARLSQIVGICGGWQNFLETPIPVIIELNKYCNLLDEREAQIIKAWGGKIRKK